MRQRSSYMVLTSHPHAPTLVFPVSNLPIFVTPGPPGPHILKTSALPTKSQTCRGWVVNSVIRVQQLSLGFLGSVLSFPSPPA